MQQQSGQSTSQARPASQSIRPQEVQSILNNGPEYVVSPTSASPTRRSFQSHSRTMSTVSATTDTGGTRANRFSLQYPIQPVTEIDNQERQFETSRAIPDPVVPAAVPTDASFLTAIAAQERRVLELKEELQRAEVELGRLKKQWTTHEASRKRNSAGKLTKLEPLATSNLPIRTSLDDENGSGSRMQQEMERRALLLNGKRQSGRRVFSSSKHARTLSLLSSSATNPLERLPVRSSTQNLDNTSIVEGVQPESKPTRLPDAADSATLTADNAQESDATRRTFPELMEIENLQAIDGDKLIKSGRKLATDFRDGLWTFIEDLRQATVGDEATRIMPPGRPPGGPRRQSSDQMLKVAGQKNSKSNLRSSSKTGTTRNTNGEHGVSPSRSPKAMRSSQTRPKNMSESKSLDDADPPISSVDTVPTTPAVKTGTPNQKTPGTVETDTSAWDMWEETSPLPSATDSRSSSVASNNASTPRTSSSTVDDNRGPKWDGRLESIPWPEISKFGTSQLKRTASRLMSEWERSLTPSPGKEWKGAPDDYLGMSAEAAAVSPGGKMD